MSRKISTGRKLSTDMHRKLSAISNCSDISNLSFKLGMDPDDFKSTIQNILDLDTGDDLWTGDSDDETGSLNYFGEDEDDQSISSDVAALNRQIAADAVNVAATDVITIKVDRKSSTGSQASTDSLDLAEGFEPVEIDVGSLKTVLHKYQRHKKISMSKLHQPPPPAQH